MKFEGFVLVWLEKLMFSGREAESGTRVSNHWAWSRGELLICSLGKKEKDRAR